MTAPEIVSLGEALAEFVKISDTEGRSIYRQGFGGDTSNTIIAAARQGAATGYITAVGKDDFGIGLIDLWQSEGVATGDVRVSETDPTGAYFVWPDASGRAFSYARRGSAASLYGPNDLPEGTIRNAKIFHTSALSMAISPTMRAAARRGAEIARKAGTLVAFDTNLRLNLWTLDDAKTAIEDILPLVDIVLPSDDEAEQLTGLSDSDSIIDAFMSKGARIVVLKRGAAGALIATKEARFPIAPAPSKPVDSTGAGDSFAGAFLAYYLETNDVELAGKRAARVAASTVSGIGAVASIPRRANVVT